MQPARSRELISAPKAVEIYEDIGYPSIDRRCYILIHRLINDCLPSEEQFEGGFFISLEFPQHACAHTVVEPGPDWRSKPASLCSRVRSGFLYFRRSALAVVSTRVGRDILDDKLYLLR